MFARERRAALLACITLTGCGAAPDPKPDQAAMREDMQQLEPGRWVGRSSIARVEMPGMSEPGFEQRRARAEARAQDGPFSVCLGASDFARQGATLLAGNAGADCRLDKLAMQDGRLTAQLACAPGGDPSLAKRIDGRYTATSFAADTRLAMIDQHMPGGGMTLVARVEGRHMGPC